MWERLVPHAKLRRDCRQCGVRGPQWSLRYQCGGEEMDVDPTQTTTMNLAIANKRDHIPMWNRWRPNHLLIARKERLSATDIANQEFAVD